MYEYTVRKGNKHSVERIKTKLNLLSLLIFSVISFQFNGENYLQIHGTAMDTKMAVAIANIFMAKVETEI